MMFSENEIKKGLRISIWEGVFATVHGTVTTGAFLTGFALLLGANDFQIGLLTAIPLLTQVLQIFSVHAVERFGIRKWISGYSSVMGRSLWAIIVLIPLVSALQTSPINVFLIFFIISSATLSFSGAAWLSWMADLVPAKSRGKYFGQRNMIMGAVTMITSIFAGQVLDFFKLKSSLAYGFLIIEMIAVLCGIIAFAFLIKQPEPQYQRFTSYSFKSYILQPFKINSFRKLLSFYLFYTFALGLASGYFPVYLLKTLNWSFSNLAILAIGNSFMTLLTQPLWGRIIDRVGHKPVIKTTVAGLLPLPLIYIMASPLHSWPIWLDIFFTGVFWSGFNLVMFNMVFYSLPQQGRPGFIAVYSALTGLVNFIAMVLSGALAQFLAPYSFMIGSYKFINYHFLFMMTFLCRIFAFRLINRLEEVDAASVGVMIWHIFSTLNRHIGFGRSVWMLGKNNKT